MLPLCGLSKGKFGMEDKYLKQLILNLLEPEILKTTEQVVEEFRMEYPVQWKALEKEGEMLYGNSCSSVQQPFTRISQVLINLPANESISVRKSNVTYWRKSKLA